MEEQKTKIEEKSSENKKQENKSVVKKNAVVHGRDTNVSTKHAMAICNMIRGKSIEHAISMLEKVQIFKQVVKMNNREIGHRKGKGIMAGRYPINASKEFVRLLKQLNANALVNEIEPNEYVLFCKADRASRPFRRGGTRFKRSHITIMLEKPKKNEKNKIKIKRTK